MENLNDMLHNMKLSDIESLFQTQFDNLETGYYDAKLAVMMSLITTLGIEVLDKINISNFPTALANKLETTKKAYTAKIEVMKQRLDEDAKIIKAIDKTESKGAELRMQIDNLLSELDGIIKEEVTVRDHTPVSKL